MSVAGWVEILSLFHFMGQFRPLETMMLHSCRWHKMSYYIFLRNKTLIFFLVYV